MRAVRVTSANVPLVQVLAAAAVSGVICVATSLSASNRLSPGEFIGFVTAMSMLFEPIRRLTNVNATIQSGLAGAQSIYELIDLPSEPELPAGSGGTLPTARASGHIRFEQVCFRYPGHEGWAVDDFTLDIPAGQTVALVGSSGSGKTTVASLLARFFNSEQGRILVDGVAIDALPLSQWREQIAFVGQQVVLFDDSVAANIAYGRPDIERERIEQAARAACALSSSSDCRRAWTRRSARTAPASRAASASVIAIARAFLRTRPS